MSRHKVPEISNKVLQKYTHNKSGTYCDILITRKCLLWLCKYVMRYVPDALLSDKELFLGPRAKLHIQPAAISCLREWFPNNKKVARNWKENNLK